MKTVKFSFTRMCEHLCFIVIQQNIRVARWICQLKQKCLSVISANLYNYKSGKISKIAVVRIWLFEKSLQKSQIRRALLLELAKQSIWQLAYFAELSCPLFLPNIVNEKFHK